MTSPPPPNAPPPTGPPPTGAGAAQPGAGDGFGPPRGFGPPTGAPGHGAAPARGPLPGAQGAAAAGAVPGPPAHGAQSLPGPLSAAAGPVPGAPGPVPGGYGPPGPYGQPAPYGAYAQPYAPPPPPPSGGKAAKVAAIVIACVLAAGVVVGGLILVAGGGQREADAEDAKPSHAPSRQHAPGGSGLPDPSSSPDAHRVQYVVLKPGQCFDHPTLTSGITEVRTTSCSGRHDGEVVANETLTGTFSSQQEIRERARALCEGAVRARLRAMPDGHQRFYSFSLFPVKRTYERGEDQVTCALTRSLSPDGPKLTAPLPG
ncbi:septum formation family protein [Streptomyces gamaensis]|uniref:Septum formation family protein n=1 Tax=Streptomyces gamaensis TaxID=1763542 RepID=A0ABW0Z2P4_9ACTN